MSIRTAREIVAGLDIVDPVSSVEFVEEGYSTDRKFILWVGDQPRYLLRVSDPSEEPRRREEFDLLRQLHASGIICPKAIEFGASGADGLCFQLVTYIPGECAETAIPKLKDGGQYAVGVAAGRELHRIHESMTPPKAMDWYEVRTEKHNAYRRAAEEMRLGYEGQEQIETFIQDHLSLMRGRPTSFLHADYHPGNLIIREDELAGVIDFGNSRWGDPYFEFYKVAQFGAPLNVPFACGQIDGYFPGGVPDDFWPLYNLYVAMVLIADLVWTQRRLPSKMDTSYALNREILATHDFVSAGAPAWYTPAGA